MSHLFRRCCVLLASAAVVAGCSSYQPTKNVWKGTKDVWYTYVSPPASVDYGEKGDLSPRALALTNCMMGLDVELGRFERVMLNADKPPTRQWLDSLFAAHPWLDGFAGVKYDGTLLGQEPENPLKQLDFIPLLYEDKKQGSRALRADVQQTPMGPEVMLAAPLYDGVDFLGVVVAYFDMRSLVQYSGNPQDMVVLSPQALLWPGKYDYAATPLASVNWEEVTSKSSSGTCSNATGSFYYMVRYLGNLPLVFAVPESGTFPEGNGSVDQGLPFFPKEREKLPPPPMPERKKDDTRTTPVFGASEDAMDSYGDAGGGMPPQDVMPGGNIVQPPQEGAPAPSGVRERPLAGENVKPRPRPRKRLVIPDEALTVPELPEDTPPAPQIRMPSPFGPRGAAKPAGASTADEAVTPATQTVPGGDTAPAADVSEPAAPAATPAAQEVPAAPAETSAPAAPEAAPTPAATAPAPETPTAEEPAAPRRPALLPGGRPSPFGPR